MPEISLAEQHEESISTYHILSRGLEKLERKLEQADILRNLIRSDVKTLREDLTSARTPSDEAYIRKLLKEDTAKLVKARREAWHAYRQHRDAAYIVEQQIFIVDHLEAQLEQKPSSPWARRHAELKRHQTGARMYPQVPTKHIRAVCDWRRETEFCFADYSKITRFPSLPKIVKCSNQSCRVGTCESLEGCKCNIEACFRLIPQLDPSTERLRWHPDRFSACDECCRDTFRDKAHVIFVVLHELHLAK